MGNSLDMGFNLTGEGFVLISQMSYGMSTVLISIYSKKISPVVLSGTQFTMGGILLFVTGILMDGHLEHLCKQPSDSVSCSGICCRLHLMVRPAHL